MENISGDGAIKVALTWYINFCIFQGEATFLHFLAWCYIYTMPGIATLACLCNPSCAASLLARACTGHIPVPHVSALQSRHGQRPAPWACGHLTSKCQNHTKSCQRSCLVTGALCHCPTYPLWYRDMIAGLNHNGPTSGHWVVLLEAKLGAPSAMAWIWNPGEWQMGWQDWWLDEAQWVGCIFNYTISNCVGLQPTTVIRYLTEGTWVLYCPDFPI